MFKNITKEMVTSTVAALVGLAVVYGIIVPEQATAITSAAASLAALVLAFAKDPK